jgi:hypothetical protein
MKKKLLFATLCMLFVCFVFAFSAFSGYKAHRVTPFSKTHAKKGIITGTKIPKCTITLLNDIWEPNIKVWVKTGSFSDCNRNPDYGEKIYTINKGGSIQVYTGDKLCYRREVRSGSKPLAWEAQWHEEACYGHDKTVPIR